MSKMEAHEKQDADVLTKTAKDLEDAAKQQAAKFPPLKDGEIRIMLGVPGGGSCRWETAKAIFMATKAKGRYAIFDSMYSNGNFNALWMDALNHGRDRRFSHFVSIHTDVNPGTWWLDILLEECEKKQADLVSVATAIKDPRGLTSSGIGDPNDRWRPFRRFTVQEMSDVLPETFSAEDIGYGDKFLIHNHGMWIVDLRKPVWYQMQPDGKAPAYFVYDEEVFWTGTKWERRVESEDWFFSRLAAKAGVKSYITSRIKTIHHGQWIFLNWGHWGTYHNGDDDTADKWRKVGALDPMAVAARQAPPSRTVSDTYAPPAEIKED